MLKAFLVTGFANRLKQVRTKKNIKREIIADKIGASWAIIGRYEHGERTPSIDITKKIAEALGISLDYLVGDTSVLVEAKDILKRIEDIVNLLDENKKYVLNLIDMCLRDFKTK